MKVYHNLPFSVQIELGGPLWGTGSFRAQFFPGSIRSGKRGVRWLWKESGQNAQVYLTLAVRQ